MSKEEAVRNMGEQVARNIKDGQLLGLGSGSAVASFVDALGKRIQNEKLEIHGIPTSMQVEIIAKSNGIILESSSLIPQIDIVVDGADQIDTNFVMIKGGGGAHFREKIMIKAANESIIVADSSKYVEIITWPVPLEVSEFSRFFVEEKIKSMSGNPVLRTLDKGYPFFTQNGNLVIDAHFGEITNPKNLEQLLRTFPMFFSSLYAGIRITVFSR